MSEMTINMTMTSLEIAEFCGKEHRNVLADVRNMLIELGIDATEFSAARTYGNNNTREVFNLNKELTISLVSGYDIVARHKIVKRWLELEEQQRKQLPQTHIEAVRAYLVTLETVDTQQKQIVQQIETINHKNILTNDSEVYFPVLRARELLPTARFSGAILNRVSESMQLPPKQLFTTGKLNAINTYHKDVWKVVYPEVNF